MDPASSVALEKNPPANTRDRGSIPDPGRPPRAEEQLSSCALTALTIEPVL